MFELEIDDRFTAWSLLRKQINESSTPLADLVDFWSSTPFTAHNHNIDPYYPASWPTPWEIIVDNVYDDFTKAVMMGWTLLLTDRYKDSSIYVKTLVDKPHNRLYNIVVVDNHWALNYQDNQVVEVDSIPSLYRLENQVELVKPR
jgi:hypothetical protein